MLLPPFLFSQGGGKDIYGNAIQYYEFEVKDCFKAVKFSGKILKDSMKPNTVMKGQRVWRTISLENRENQALFNTNNKCLQVGLFEVIKFGLIEKKLNVFFSDNFNEAGKNRLTQKDILKGISVRDTSESVVFDKDGNETKSTLIENRYLTNNDIKTYLVKEDWFMSSKTGQLEKKIVGIAPLVFDKKTEKIVPLFWMYFNEWKELLDAFEARNTTGDGKRISYAWLFENHYFVSQVSKESNVFDRSVKEVSHTTDVQLENEINKQKTANGEGDMFQN